jgi:hypothetical protein
MLFTLLPADKIYMANACFYFSGGMRDVGWFWFMPTAGKFPSFLPAKSHQALFSDTDNSDIEN